MDATWQQKVTSLMEMTEDELQTGRSLIVEKDKIYSLRKFINKINQLNEHSEMGIILSCSGDKIIISSRYIN